MKVLYNKKKIYFKIQQYPRRLAGIFVNSAPTGKWHEVPKGGNTISCTGMTMLWNNIDIT